MSNIEKRIKLARIKLIQAEKEIKAAIELANDLKQIGTVKILLQILNKNNETIIKLKDAGI